MNILAVGPAWVGDMVMAQSLFITLKEQNPNCVIDVLAPDWSFPLLDRMPEVRSAIRMPLKHGEFDLKTRYRLGRSLANKYQKAFVLPNSWKSALVPFFANISVRTGWHGEMRFGLLNDIRILNKKKYPRMVQRYAALAYPKGAPVPQQPAWPCLHIEEEARSKAVQKFNLTTDAPILALCPGAEFGPSKRWPEEYYATIADQKSREGWAVWIFGSPKDGEVAAQIQSKMREKSVDLTGKTTLAEAIDLLSLANLAVTNDSGLMHICAALKRPLVAVYGSTDPSFTPPLGDNIRIVQMDLSCVPCFQRECPLLHHQCMKSLKPDMVLDAMQSLAS